MFYLKEIRLTRGMSRIELARRVGLTENAIYLYETQKRKPDYEMLLKLAGALNCTVSDIVGDSQNADLSEELGGAPLTEGDRILFRASRNATEEDKKRAAAFLEAIRKI